MNPILLCCLSLSCVAPLAGQDDDSAVPRVVVRPAPGAPVDVGAVRLQTGYWSDDTGDWRAARPWGAAVRHGSVVLRGSEVHLFTEGVDTASPWPLWLGDRDGTLVECEPVRWRRMGDFALGKSSVPALGVGVTLALSAGRLSATLDQSRVSHATFIVEGAEHLALFVDPDFDGAIERVDYWVAGPAAHVRRLRFPNPEYEMRRLDEGWCLGDRSLRVTAVAADGAITLDVGPGGMRTEFRDAHAARVDGAFFAGWSRTRDEYMVERGDPSGRPVVAHPAAWHHASSLDEALQWAAAQRKPLLVEYTSRSCPYCKFLEWGALHDAGVDAALAPFARARVVVELDAVRPFHELDHGVPCTIRYDLDGAEVARLAGTVGAVRYLRWLQNDRGRSARATRARAAGAVAAAPR
jgi:hypothetical protein